MTAKIDDIATQIAVAIYDVLRQHDNESIQEADWRQLANEMAMKAANKLAQTPPLRCTCNDEDANPFTGCQVHR